MKLKTANSDVPVDLFVHYLTSAFFAVLIWWMDRRSRVDTVANRRSLSLLGASNGTRGSSMKCSIRLQMGRPVAAATETHLVQGSFSQKRCSVSPLVFRADRPRLLDYVLI